MDAELGCGGGLRERGGFGGFCRYGVFRWCGGRDGGGCVAGGVGVFEDGGVAVGRVGLLSI